MKKYYLSLFAALAMIAAAAIGLTQVTSELTLRWDYNDFPIDGFVVGYGPVDACGDLDPEACQFPSMAEVAPDVLSFSLQKSAFADWSSNQAFFRVAAYRNATIEGEQTRIYSVWSEPASASVITILRPTQPGGVTVDGNLIIIK
jgi:hypothetical protein